MVNRYELVVVCYPDRYFTSLLPKPIYSSTSLQCEYSYLTYDQRSTNHLRQLK